jgi:hypothetical protein
MSIVSTITLLYNEVPRRFTPDNFKAFNEVVSNYEDVLISVEAINEYFEGQVPVYFDVVAEVKVTIKNCNNSKASKKVKDNYFDEAADKLKDNMQELIDLLKENNQQ